MPSCLICGIRSFSSSGGLKRHLRASNVTHPYCDICDKLFGSLQGYDMHMASVHPRVRGCGMCNVRFRSHTALSAHYRASASHPTCVPCRLGLKNAVELQQHNWTCHPQVRCELCDMEIDGRADALLAHYHQSPSHPTCHSHNLGFKDYAEWVRHCESVHKIGTGTSPSSPSSPSPKAFSAPPILQSTPASPPSSPPLPPLPPSSTPADVEIPEPPVAIVESSPPSEPEPTPTPPPEPVNRRRSATPPAPLPLLPVPPAEIHQPRPDDDEDPEFAFAFESSSSSSASSPTQILQADAESPDATMKSVGVGGSDDDEEVHGRDFTFSITSTPGSPPHDALEDSGVGLEDSGVGLADSGLVEALAQTAGSSNLRILDAPMFAVPRRSLGGTNPHPDPDPDPDPADPAVEVEVEVAVEVENKFGVPASPVLSEPEPERCCFTREPSASPSPSPALSPRSARAHTDDTDEDVEVDAKSKSKVRYTPNEGQSWPPSPLHTRHARHARHASYPSTSTYPSTDPSTSTLAFTKPAIRISTASSRNSDSPPSSSSSVSDSGGSTDTSGSTDSSAPFARSPSVAAPAGLAALPSTSPFELTPIDPDPDPPVYALRARRRSLQISIPDIPEHPNTHTLLHLAASLSPPMPLSDEPDELLTPSSLSRFGDSPQDGDSPRGGEGEGEWKACGDGEGGWKKYGESIMAEELPLPLPLTDSESESGASSVGSSPRGCGCGSEGGTRTRSSLERFCKSDVEDVRGDGATDPPPPPPPLRPPTLVQARDCVPQNRTTETEPRLHCRICNRNPCVDITATMCGHVFCFGCITECVVQRSRCPTCLAPTLLYCLFRLDLCA